MATIKEIARLAGVSRGTVDRVLNNRSGVNAETEQRVRQIAESLNYTPSLAGRSLALHKKNLKIGFIIASEVTPNSFFGEMAEGARARAEKMEDGITVDIVSCGATDVDAQAELIDRMVADGINALAIVPIDHPKIAQRLRSAVDQGIPVVTVSTDIHNAGRLAYVGSDYHKNGQTAAGLMSLLTDGRASVGIVYGSATRRSHVLCIQGFRECLEAKYPDIAITRTLENNDDDIDSYLRVKEMLEKNPEINGLFLVSEGIYGAARAVSEMHHPCKIICSDCLPMTQELIRFGIIQVAIDQQPFIQGSRPLTLLYNILALKKMPEEKYNFTDALIKVAENL